MRWPCHVDLYLNINSQTLKWVFFNLTFTNRRQHGPLFLSCTILDHKKCQLSVLAYQNSLVHLWMLESSKAMLFVYLKIVGTSNSIELEALSVCFERHLCLFYCSFLHWLKSKIIDVLSLSVKVVVEVAAVCLLFGIKTAVPDETFEILRYY